MLSCGRPNTTRVLPRTSTDETALVAGDQAARNPPPCIDVPGSGDPFSRSPPFILPVLKLRRLPLAIPGGPRSLGNRVDFS